MLKLRISLFAAVLLMNASTGRGQWVRAVSGKLSAVGCHKVVITR
jgi:hypothetical protein